MNQGIPVEWQSDNESVFTNKGDFADRNYIAAEGDQLRLASLLVRPEIPEGRAGCGAKGKLDIDGIRSLATGNSR